MKDRNKVILFSVTAVIVICSVFFAVFSINYNSRMKPYTAGKDGDAVLGQCAACHISATPVVVEQWTKGKMADAGVTCYDCHTAERVIATGNEEIIDENIIAHNGFEIINNPGAGNCSQCHSREYEEFQRSGHAAKAWISVKGAEAFNEAQLTSIASYHPEKLNAAENYLGKLQSSFIEGDYAIKLGCSKCHGIGKPNPDNSIGNCSDCHFRHQFKMEQAREPATCGTCHIGPDHPQIEIWEESTHGVIFNMDKDHYDLAVRDQDASDQLSPSCATCHMSGFSGGQRTHDVNERLAWYGYPAYSKGRDDWKANRNEMVKTCSSCHSSDYIYEFLYNADKVVEDVNTKNAFGKFWFTILLFEGKRTSENFDESIEFNYFNLWHHWGRSEKYGAFMGGADYVQWHGNYPLLNDLVIIQEKTEEELGSEYYSILSSIIKENDREGLAKYYSGDELTALYDILDLIYDTSVYDNSPLDPAYVKTILGD